MDVVPKAISGTGWVGLDISERGEILSTFGTNNIISERREHLGNNDASTVRVPQKGHYRMLNYNDIFGWIKWLIYFVQKHILPHHKAYDISLLRIKTKATFV